MKFRIAIALAAAFATLRGDDSPDPRLLTLDVIAVDNHGQPVNDLTADDFQITDANKPQKISLFRHKDATKWQVPNLAPNEVSNRGAGVPNATVILFDLMNESFGTRGNAADHIVRCLETLESAENVYLYFLTVEGRLFGVHGLTEDGPEPGTASWNTKIKPLMDKALHDVVRTRPMEIDIAVRVQLTFASLESLGMQLSGIPGRKNVVWVTDGVPITLGPTRSDTGETVDFTPQLRRLSEALSRANVSLYPVRQLMIGTPDRIDASATGETDLAGNRGGSRTRPSMDFDSVGAGSQSLNTLNTLADMTGGRQNSGKDICGALKQAMSDTRVGYQIGYAPPASNWDGKYHKLRVTCKRKGVHIQAKTGYFAFVDEPGNGAEQAIHSLSSATFDAAEIGLQGSLTATDLKARIDAKDLDLVQEGDHFNGQLRLVILGYRADGGVDSTKVIPLDLHYTAEQRDQAQKDGVPFIRNLPANVKLTKVRLIVYDQKSTAIGSLTIPVNYK